MMPHRKIRTHDSKRPVLLTKKTLASWGPSTHEAAKEKAPVHMEVDTGAKYMLIAGLRAELVHPREPTSPSTTACNNLQANV